MADVTTVKRTYRWTFDLTRDGDTTTRTISADDISTTEQGLSAAKAFRDMFNGSASSPLTIIDPQTFIQPTGWRDNNPNEAPWTTADCTLARIDETTTYYENPVTPVTEVRLEFDAEDDVGTVYRPGTGRVNVYSESGGALTPVSVNAPENPDGVGFLVEANTNYVAQIAAQGDYPAAIVAGRYTK